MLQLANLSSEGIIVHEHGAVSIPSSVQFKTHYSVCGLDTAEGYRVEFLKERWHYFNTHLFGGLLKEPPFVISNKVRFLGIWYPGLKKMEFGKKMFKQPKEMPLLGVMVHEMAHQYVSEVLHSPDVDAHGPSWQHVMESVGMTTDDKYRGPELKTIDKIQKQEEVRRVLDNNKGFDVERFRSTKYEVMRYVNPSRMRDVPIIIDPVFRPSMFLHGWEVKKDGTLGRVRETFNASFVVVPGSLKIRTPLYRQAQLLADKMNEDTPPPVGA